MNALTTIIPVDRVRAATRAAWIGGCGVLLAAALIAGAGRLRWSIMWVNERAALLALAGLGALTAALALHLLWRGLRWGLLAVWPAPVCVEFGPDALALRLGPFRTYRLAWDAMRVTVHSDADAPALPADDDPPVPELRHPTFGGDVADTILRFTAADAARLNAALAPYLQASLTTS